MEDLVVDPLEAKLTALEGIKKVTSSMSDGLAVLFVQYKHEYDVDEKYQEVVREVNNMRNELPADIYSINMWKWRSGKRNLSGRWEKRSCSPSS